MQRASQEFLEEVMEAVCWLLLLGSNHEQPARIQLAQHRTAVLAVQNKIANERIHFMQYRSFEHETAEEIGLLLQNFAGQEMIYLVPSGRSPAEGKTLP